MANYCTAEDVNVLLGMDNAFQDGAEATRPTLTQVNNQISIVTGEIDFTLNSVGITTQPTDSNLLLRLNQMCQYGVACNVGMSGMSNNTSVEDSQPGFYCERYQEMLQDIKDNPENYGKITGDDVIYASNQVIDGTISESDQTDQFVDQDFEF